MTQHPDPEATTGEAAAWRAGAQWGMRQPHPETERLVAEAYAYGRRAGLGEALRIAKDYAGRSTTQVVADIRALMGQPTQPAAWRHTPPGDEPTGLEGRGA